MLRAALGQLGARTRVLAGISLLAAVGWAQEPVAAPRPADLAARYCAECHSGEEPERGFRVEGLFGDGVAQDGMEAQRVQQALVRLRSRTMPPPDAPQPVAGERLALVASLAAREPDAADARTPTMRRLSRAEYRNTVQSLFGVPWDERLALPEDSVAHGFDNLGDVANLSPLAFEQYHDAASALARTVVGDRAVAQRVFGPDSRRGPVATERVLEHLLLRAFRRPALDAEVQERTRMFDALVAGGSPVEEAQAALLRSVLASPAFLFRIEADAGQEEGSKGPQPLGAHELAVRLSYLLTSSAPDARLAACAADGSILHDEVRVAEARRLVQATAGRALADHFGAQWLGYRQVLAANADFRRYPQIWNQRLRPSLYEEAARFFAAMVAGDESILVLLDSSHTYLDDVLSRHYGIGDVKGREFVRVELPDRRRGGILGMGAMLMTSSHSSRTSPVLRGRWVLERLLDLPPPPPPPGAGTLPPDDAPVEGLSLRARLERHRSQKACASCHAHIDPLGFALENYDVVGVWRDTLHEQPVDARGTLVDGTEVDGPVALRDALLARKDDFVRTFAARLLTYAIGRQLHGRDEPELARIVTACAANGHRFSALLEAVVTSPLFTHRGPPGSS